MQSNHKVLSRNDVVICGAWKYMLLIERNFPMVVINADDGTASSVSLANFVEDSNSVTNSNHEFCVCLSKRVMRELFEFEVLQ